MRLFHLFCLIALLSACGTSERPAMTKEDAKAPVGESFSITRFDPPSGSAMPASINITFSEIDLNQVSVTALTHFNMVCNGYAFAASSVVYSSGSIIANVSFPAITGFPSGTACQFIVSSNLVSSAGAHLAGLRSAAYIL